MYCFFILLSSFTPFPLSSFIASLSSSSKFSKTFGCKRSKKYWGRPNRLCRVHKNIYERKAEPGLLEETKIVLMAERETHGRRQRQYDHTSVNEIVVLIPGDNTAIEPGARNIQVKDRHLKSICEIYAVYYAQS